MAWIRDTDEQAQRRPADIALLIVAGVTAALAGMWAQTQSAVDLNLSEAEWKKLLDDLKSRKGQK